MNPLNSPPSTTPACTVRPEHASSDVAAQRLALRGATLGYGREPIAEGLDLSVRDGSLTIIIGPNGCGKSTALRAMARLLTPSAGQVILDGRDIRSLRTKDIAKRLGLLPQASVAPEGIRVAELVARGRHPHQGPLRQWTREDEEAVAEAMAVTGVSAYAHRQVDELSGGQRQRVWVAMVLAQRTPVLLLDEPTTYLDIAHQLDILELCAALQRRGGQTTAVVLHDLNHACRYATHLIAMRAGRVVATGAPGDIVTPELIREVFDVEAVVIPDPVAGTPLVIPVGGGHHHAEALPG